MIRPRDSKKKATEEEVEELLAQVGRDLEPWKESGITLEMVEKAYCTEDISESMRIQVRVSSTAGRWVERDRRRLCRIHVSSAIWQTLTNVVSNADHKSFHLLGGAYFIL